MNIYPSIGKHNSFSVFMMSVVSLSLKWVVEAQQSCKTFPVTYAISFCLKILVRRSSSPAELDLKDDLPQTQGKCRERQKSKLQET